MNRTQAQPKQKDKETDREQIDELLSEISNMDIYATIKRWEALYPHTYGDQILKELLSRER